MDMALFLQGMKQYAQGHTMQEIAQNMKQEKKETTKENYTLQWEKLQSENDKNRETHKMTIPGGILIRTIIWTDDHMIPTTAMTYIPNPQEWEKK
jgi:hypothetical protein